MIVATTSLLLHIHDKILSTDTLDDWLISFIQDLLVMDPYRRSSPALEHPFILLRAFCMHEGGILLTYHEARWLGVSHSGRVFSMPMIVN